MTAVADDLLAARAEDRLRRAEVVLSQAVDLAADAVAQLEHRAAVTGGEPSGRVVALRGRLEEVRGRAATVRQVLA